MVDFEQVETGLFPTCFKFTYLLMRESIFSVNNNDTRTIFMDVFSVDFEQIFLNCSANI